MEELASSAEMPVISTRRENDRHRDAGDQRRRAGDLDAQ
jgi:hypothetical protein